MPAARFSRPAISRGALALAGAAPASPRVPGELDRGVPFGYHYEVRFASSTGTPISDYTVDGASGNINATAPIGNKLANCSGQGVRSFISINVGRAGKSAQNPENGWVS